MEHIDFVLWCVLVPLMVQLDEHISIKSDLLLGEKPNRSLSTTWFWFYLIGAMMIFASSKL